MDDAYRLIVAFCKSTVEGQSLLAAEPDLAVARTGLEETPLHYLAVENQLEAVQVLVAFGSDINTLNHFGATPLSDAASLGHAEIVKFLLSAGAKIGVDGQDEPTLIRAVSSGSVETVHMLLDAGADVDVRNDLDETALHIAAEKDHIEIIRLLVSAGADLNARANFDKTPLMAAEWAGANLAAEELSSLATRALVRHIGRDFDVTELDHELWYSAQDVGVNTYWSGQPALTKHRFRFRLLWSKEALYARFYANQRGPLNILGSPNLTEKTIELWDRDVCEIFIAPDKAVRNKYFEFEIAPTGEWVDLAIEVTPEGRLTDLDYSSGMTSAAKIEKDKIVTAIRIPWTAFGKVPEPGDIWLGNIFRCVGEGETRGYLAWQSTATAKPNFHVPSRFGEFEFVE
ncbi:MAG: ankyrin repeat domain-containing protein [Pyrinomonadaceae bacterium]|nr:ankyrin repeat domain-containing protein [Pyrinomonadaceae bacterium]MBP6211436.1 ankyrin repeat domain-containing protein [Pyrinomonadaceae bacterium]